MPSMEEIKLSLSQSGPAGELSIIRVDGVVDTITASELENVIESLIGQKKYNIIVDLGGVEYISSAGWGIFISRIQEVRDQEGDIKLVNMIPNVYEIYELLEFQNIIPAFESLESCKKAFNISDDEANSGSGERVWKTEQEVVPESGMAIQVAMSPGRRDRKSQPKPNLSRTGDSPEQVIIELVVNDPFNSIGELVDQANEIAPRFRFGWWKVFAILRRQKLLSRRARFRLARKRNRSRQY